MTLLKCIVVDDDQLSRKVIEEYCSKTESTELIYSFSSAVEAVNTLKADDRFDDIDLIFLDIEMPEMTGIEFLKVFPNSLPNIIIISSKEKYALETYEYEVVDYLLKPIQYPRFLQSVNKVLKRQKKNEKVVSKSEEIFIKNNASLVRLNYDDILWIEALENYVVLNTFKEKYTIHFTMKAIADRMPTDRFVRVHRSFIVNLGKVSMIEDNTVVIKYEGGNKVIPIGKSYKDQLMNDINLMTKNN